MQKLLWVVAGLVIACGEESASKSEGECSTGPTHDESSRFAEGEREDPELSCTPHCGQTEQYRWRETGTLVYDVSSLPSGVCAENTEPCSMDVGLACGTEERAIWHKFVCKCESGSWVCTSNYEAGGICPAAK